MSDFYNEPIARVSRRPRRCIACFHQIEKGEGYTFQSGNYDGKWYGNHFHSECFEVLCDDGDFEFTPGYADPPERLAA